MKQLTILYFVMCLYGVTDLAVGQSPLPMDPPTPPPCAADGTCYPRTSEWGYYPARWRTWPGVELTPTPAGPTPADGRVSEELSHTEPPPAEFEDAAAPPSSPKREPSSAEPPAAGEGAPSEGGGGLPRIPLPDDENSPLGPTSSSDPPPVLPFTISSPSSPSADHRDVGPTLRRPGTARVSTSDPPPAPPWVHRAAL